MTMEKGRIAQWVANDGDQVQAEQVVLILETEKVAHEIVAPIPGILAILGKAGDEYPCGTVVGVVAETAPEYEAVKKNPATYAASAEAGASSDEAAAPEQTDLPVEIPIQVQIGARERIRISPLARKLAQVHELDVSILAGSGPEGRIVKRDIEQAVEAREQKKAVSAPAAAEVCAGKRVRAVIPLTGMRKTIADHLHQSTSSTARVSAMIEFDMTELVKLRSHYVSKAPVLGFKITYTDLFIYMAAKALKAVPIINASIVDDEIKLWEDINIGFAVSVMKSADESGLLVPVIRNADQLTLGQVSKARKDLMDKARAGTISLDELSGGTFTITNTGTFTSLWHIQTPIINQPESAILGTSSIVERPVVINGEIAIRPIMPMSFAFDHRVMDGAPPAQFMGLLQQMIEDPWMILM
jgi:pyruvate dehydrogenase E2 component (dihydrolipoamide acetyltransferase)/2-oxoglutarate dehydrogenase E2 component (dihydrolipoamide succinyltransferase)